MLWLILLGFVLVLGVVLYRRERRGSSFALRGKGVDADAHRSELEYKASIARGTHVHRPNHEGMWGS